MDACSPSTLPGRKLRSIDMPIIATLIAEIDRCLTNCSGAGVADVRAGIKRWTTGQARTVTPASHLVAEKYLAQCLAAMADPSLALAISEAAPCLRWTPYDSYPVDEIGEIFANGNCFASLIGDDGFYSSDDFALGLFIVAPDVIYRDHHHAAPELYLPFTGPHAWRFLPDKTVTWLPAGVPVWNDAWRTHATRTGSTPFLSLFGWTQDVSQAARVVQSDDWQTIRQSR